MSTILFNEIIFGPVKSRRLGVSLGVNLLPYDGKLCSFDCIYCECGFNSDFRTKTAMPSRQNVKDAMTDKLSKMKNSGQIPDVITFAGNGEPTLHPQFEQIIDDTIQLRNLYFPSARISVLSNAMHVQKESIFRAMLKVDDAILKLDSAFDQTVRLIDRPNSPAYSVKQQVEMFKRFEGKFVLQTMFLQGEFEGKRIDNTSEPEIEAWLAIIAETRPREVMIYTIDRETPSKNLEKTPIETLRKIADRVQALGVPTVVAG